MKTLLLNVSYGDNTNKFWQESSIRNKKISFNSDTENIHEVIKVICEEQDGMELTYKGKPQGNIHRDIVDENEEIIGNKIVGYIYRGRSEIYNRNMVKSQIALFDVCVSISEVIQFEIDEIY